jgi:hypothetical protein
MIPETGRQRAIPGRIPASARQPATVADRGVAGSGDDSGGVQPVAGRRRQVHHAAVAINRRPQGEHAMHTRLIDPPRWYWLAASLALLWMLFGVAALTMDILMDEAAMAALTDGQRQLYAERPQWLFAVYAVAIGSGLIGAIGLLLRKAWAVPILMISLLAVLVQFGYTFAVMDPIAKLGSAAAAVPFPLAIIVAGMLVLWLGLHARRRGWLG